MEITTISLSVAKPLSDWIRYGCAIPVCVDKVWIRKTHLAVEVSPTLLSLLLILFMLFMLFMFFIRFMRSLRRGFPGPLHSLENRCGM